MDTLPIVGDGFALRLAQPARGRTPAIRAALRRAGQWALPWLLPVALLASWQAVVWGELVSPQLLVPPGQVLVTFVELVRSGELLEHLRESLGRLAFGFGCGASAGVLLGTAMGTSPRLEAYAQPFFHAARQLPTVALIPVFILAFGVEETFKVLLVAKACFFAVALSALDGTRNIGRKFLEVAAIYQLPRAVFLRRLVLPAVVPSVVAGVRISLGRAWMVLVAAELMAADRGLGQMMEMGRQMFRMDVVLVGVIVTGTVGLFLDRSVRWIERRALRWRPASW